MEEGEHKKFVYFAVFLILAILSFLLIKRFVLVVLSGILVAYIFHPLHKRLARHMRKGISAFLMTLLVFFIIMIPLLFLFQVIVKDVYTGYFVFKQKMGEGLPDLECIVGTFSCDLAVKLHALLETSDWTTQIQNAISQGTAYIAKRSSDFIIHIPQRVLDLFIFLIIFYYTLKDGKDILAKFQSAVPLRAAHQQRIFRKVNEMVYSIVYGNVIVAFIQGAIATVGYILFGLPSPFLWGVFTALFALIPMGGTALVWAPASLFLILNGLLFETTDIGKGIGLAIYGALLVSTVDNFLKPQIIGERANLHPALVLLGVFGGLSFFGMLGVFIGPVILGLFVTFIDIYKEERTYKIE